MDDSPFNKLSPEIRNQIYELVLTSKKKTICVNTDFKIQPPLTRTCKQIRAESVQLFYNINTFYAHINTTSPSQRLNPHDEDFRESVDNIFSWARATPKECHKAIKSLKISLVWVRWRRDSSAWVSRTDLMHKLRVELRHHGYKDDRLVLSVLAVPCLWASYGFARSQRLIPLGEVKKYFEDVEFKDVVVT